MSQSELGFDTQHSNINYNNSSQFIALLKYTAAVLRVTSIIQYTWTFLCILPVL